MEIANFDDLLKAARAQSEPQRLLFVFAGAELPGDATPAERARFERGEGGALVPLMCVDKTPAEIASFDTLVEEARLFGQDWAMVFVAALGGSGGHAPAEAVTATALERMVEAVKSGRIDSFIPFNHEGAGVVLS